MVSLETADRLVGLVGVGIVVVGSYSWWRATRRATARDGMMGQMMGTMPGMDPIWYLFGTIVAVSVVFGVYVLSRAHLAAVLAPSTPPGTPEGDGDESNTPARSEGRSSERASERPSRETSTNGPAAKRTSTLSVLPEDERRVVEPLLETPGLTQVELRGRSGFSKSKVSQTVSELEDRGLLYREKQGRTYRVYPGELLKGRR